MLAPSTPPQSENSAIAALRPSASIYPQLRHSDVICNPSPSFLAPALSPSVQEQPRVTFAPSPMRDSPNSVSPSHNLAPHSVADLMDSPHAYEEHSMERGGLMHHTLLRHSSSGKEHARAAGTSSLHHDSARENNPAISNDAGVTSFTNESAVDNIPPSPRLPPKSPGKPSASSFALSQNSSTIPNAAPKDKPKPLPRQKERSNGPHWEDLDLFGEERVYVSGPERASIASRYVLSSPSMPEVFQARSAKITAPIFPNLARHRPEANRRFLDPSESLEVSVNPFTDGLERCALPSHIVPEIVHEVEFSSLVGFEETIDIDLGHRVARVPLPYAINIRVVQLDGSIRPVSANLETDPDYPNSTLLSVISETVNFETDGAGGYEDMMLTFWAAPDTSDQESSASLVLTVIDEEGITHETTLNLGAEGTEPIIAVKRPKFASKSNRQDTDISFDKAEQTEEEVVTVWNETKHDAPLFINVIVTESGGGVFSIARDGEESCECIPTTIPACSSFSFTAQFKRPQHEGSNRFYLGTILIKLGRMTSKHDDQFKSRDYNLAFDHVISLRATAAHPASLLNGSETISQVRSMGASELQCYSDSTRGYSSFGNRGASVGQASYDVSHLMGHSRSGDQDDSTLDVSLNRRITSVASHDDSNIMKFEPLDVAVSASGIEAVTKDFEYGPLCEGIFSLMDPVEWVVCEPAEETRQTDVPTEATQEQLFKGDRASLVQSELSRNSDADVLRGPTSSRQSLHPATVSSNPLEASFGSGGSRHQDYIPAGQRSDPILEYSSIRQTSSENEINGPDGPRSSPQSSCPSAVNSGLSEPSRENDASRTPDSTPSRHRSHAISTLSARRPSEAGHEDSGNICSAESHRSKKTASSHDHESRSLVDQKQRTKSQSMSSSETMTTNTTTKTPEHSSSLSPDRKEQLVSKQGGIISRDGYPYHVLSEATPYGKMVGYEGGTIAKRTAAKTPYGKLVGYEPSDFVQKVDPAMRKLEFLEGINSSRSVGFMAKVHDGASVPITAPMKLEGLKAALRPPTPAMSDTKKHVLPFKPSLLSGTTSGAIRSAPINSEETAGRALRNAAMHGGMGSDLSHETARGKPSVDPMPTLPQLLRRSSSAATYTSAKSWSKKQNSSAEDEPKLRLPRKMREGVILGRDTESIVLPLCSGSKSNMEVQIKVLAKRTRSASVRVIVESGHLVLQPEQKAEVVIKRNIAKEKELIISLICKLLGRPETVSYEVPLFVESNSRRSSAIKFSIDRPTLTYYRTTEASCSQRLRVFNGTSRGKVIQMWVGSTQLKDQEHEPSSVFKLVSPSNVSIGAQSCSTVEVCFKGQNSAAHHTGYLNITMGRKTETLHMFGYSGSSDIRFEFSASKVLLVRNIGNRYGFVLVTGPEDGTRYSKAEKAILGPGAEFEFKMPYGSGSSIIAGDEISRRRFCAAMLRNPSGPTDKEGKNKMFSSHFPGQEEAISAEGLDFSDASTASLHYASRMFFNGLHRFQLDMDMDLVIPVLSSDATDIQNWGASIDVDGYVHICNNDPEEPLRYEMEGAGPERGEIPPLGDARNVRYRERVVVRSRGRAVELAAPLRAS